MEERRWINVEEGWIRLGDKKYFLYSENNIYHDYKSEVLNNVIFINLKSDVELTAYNGNLHKCIFLKIDCKDINKTFAEVSKTVEKENEESINIYTKYSYICDSLLYKFQMYKDKNILHISFFKKISYN